MMREREVQKVGRVSVRGESFKVKDMNRERITKGTMEVGLGISTSERVKFFDLC